MDFPPRTASHWTDEAMVPRAEFDAYVRSTERILSQLQGAVDEAVADRMSVKGALDRLASHDRRLHALERGWHEALKRLSEVEENAARPPDLKLVEARCAWLEDELREQVKPFSTRLSSPFLGPLVVVFSRPPRSVLLGRSARRWWRRSAARSSGITQRF